MLLEITVPELSESVDHGTLLTWRFGVGDAVPRDAVLVDLETDKVVLEIPSPQAGVLAEIRVEAGSTVVARQAIAVVDTEAAAVVKPEVIPEEVAPVAKVLPPSQRRHGAPVEVAAPVAKAVEPQPSLSASGSRAERREPLSHLRRRIAERLKSAQNTAAILTTFNEVDLSAVQALRARYKTEFEKRHGAKLGLMSFFMRATCEALQRFPAVNARIEGDDIIYHDYCDIGVAVSSERGLVVPILRNAETLGLAAIERAIADFAVRANALKLGLNELEGGTFSITNGGVFGSMLSTPILNPPQSAVLGMHAIQDRPVVVNGQIVIRPMMYLALSYDHRIIDGREAVSCLRTIKEGLEMPGRLLLDL